MTFNKTVHDFGTIEEGETVQTTFTFTNTGQADLIIVDAREAVDVQFPIILKTLPLLLVPSERFWSALIQAIKPNMQQKTVTISANTSSGRETLRIKAMVSPDPVKQKQRDDAAKARQQNSN